MRKLILRIEHDSDTESPNQDEHWWKLISFNRRHVDSEDASKYDLSLPENLGLRSKLRHNLAFICDYYEHSGISWSRSGHGMQCPWDTSRFAGILIFQGKPSDLKPDKRKESADSFINTYNHWANGSCYWYSLEELVTLPCGHTEERDIHSCGGFIGSCDDSGMNEDLSEYLKPGDYVEVVGDADWMKDYLKLPKGVEQVDDWDEIEENSDGVSNHVEVCN